MRNTEEVYDCPFCNSEGHLYYNIAKRVFYCFKCSKGGTAAMLERQGMTLRRQPDGMMGLNLDMMNKIGPAIQAPPKAQKPEGACYEYLRGRYVTEAQMPLFQQTVKGILCLFPDEDYWQERRWEQFSPPRWKNPTEAPRAPSDGVTYHLRGHYPAKLVVLVEGIFDAIAVAPYCNVAAMLSSNYHESQLQCLADKGYQKAILMFDKDVPTSKRIGLVSLTHQFFPIVNQFTYPEDDPGVASYATLQRLEEYDAV